VKRFSAAVWHDARNASADVVVLLLLVAGNEIARRATWLRRLNVPGSFVGGLAGSLLLLALNSMGLPAFRVSEELRDLLLIVFFVCAGLGTPVASWLRAGRPLVVLSILVSLMMVFQNVIGIGVATMLGAAPSYGVLAGSVALSGGLGSAVAWGEEFAAKGVRAATEVAVIAATLGMIIGTFVGGPYIAWVMRRKKLSAPRKSTGNGEEVNSIAVPFVEKQIILVLLLFALSIGLGDLLRDALRSIGLVTPRFLTAMFVGLAISTLADLRHLHMPRPLVERFGDICLSLFIVMALSGLDLRTLGQVAGLMIVMVTVQTVATVLFAHFVVFRLMGRDFEAATTAGGVIGVGLSSFAVAMATVKQVESNYGPAPQSVLLTTLVGGAVASLTNALIIMAFYQWLVG
jgi:ESS family glutamate:Na+ symporter